MSAYRLDVPALHAALNARRTERGLSWRGVGRETGLTPSTISRLTAGHAPDAHALVSLFIWLDLDTDIVHLTTPAEGRS